MKTLFTRHLSDQIEHRTFTNSPNPVLSFTYTGEEHYLFHILQPAPAPVTRTHVHHYCILNVTGEAIVTEMLGAAFEISFAKCW